MTIKIGICERKLYNIKGKMLSGELSADDVEYVFNALESLKSVAKMWENPVWKWKDWIKYKEIGDV